MMKLQDTDIISAARDLRDEQNEHLYVAPNPLKGRHHPTSLWWGAIAAALVVGFLLGNGTLLPHFISVDKSQQQMTEITAPSLTGKTGREASDAGTPSIIREVIHEVIHDTIYETRIVRVPSSPSKQPTAQAEPSPSPGCSMLCDDIPYNLLSGNK